MAMGSLETYLCQGMPTQSPTTPGVLMRAKSKGMRNCPSVTGGVCEISILYLPLMNTCKTPGTCGGINHERPFDGGGPHAAKGMHGGNPPGGAHGPHFDTSSPPPVPCGGLAHGKSHHRVGPSPQPQLRAAARREAAPHWPPAFSQQPMASRLQRPAATDGQGRQDMLLRTRIGRSPSHLTTPTKSPLA